MDITNINNLDHLYIRYFDTEVLVNNADEAIAFLNSLRDVTMDEILANDLRQYYESRMPYPKRYKVHPRCYFIVIKTNAKTLQEFKERPTVRHEVHPVDSRESLFGTYRPGWYDASINFKRVITNADTGKCRTVDTDFRVRLKATSMHDCYTRVTNHLRNRHDVDHRSQFPSIKGKNFVCKFLGMK